MPLSAGERYVVAGTGSYAIGRYRIPCHRLVPDPTP